jgi:hypothetical protein
MARYGPGLGRDVTLVQIEGGLHDLTLSVPAVRQALFDELRRWLTNQPGLGVGEAPDSAASTLAT